MDKPGCSSLWIFYYEAVFFTVKAQSSKELRQSFAAYCFLLGPFYLTGPDCPGVDPPQIRPRPECSWLSTWQQ